MNSENVKSLEAHLNSIKQRLKGLFSKGSQDAIHSAFQEQHETERKLAAAKGQDYAVELDIGCEPNSNASGEIFLQSEFGDSILIFDAIGSPNTGEKRYKDIGRAIIRFERCYQSKFGYPNDEAFSGHPLYCKGFSGYGVFEVVGKSWEQELIRQNRVSFPNTGDSWGLRHFLFGFKEHVLECLAEKLKVDLTDKPLDQILHDVTRHLDVPRHHIQK